MYARLSAGLSLATLVACSTPGETDDSDADGGRTPTRDANGDGGAGDPVPDSGGGADVITIDAGAEPEISGDAADLPDAPPDGGDGPPVGADGDRDGFVDRAAGGDDCDDANPRTNPGAREVCDFIDNNCSGAVNEGITCEIYAHTEEELFLVDPFTGRARQVTDVPGLFDFDTAPDGTLYGVTSGAVYRFDAGSSRWDQLSTSGTFGLGINGFAIDSASRAYATGQGTLYRIDLTSGSVTNVGDFGGDFISSGDCVIDKDDRLYMTSSGVSGWADVLVLIDAETGQATPIGSDIGYSSVFGLTVAWGYMFGFTAAGELIQIDPGTGRGSLVAEVDGRWYGAASAPER